MFKYLPKTRKFACNVNMSNTDTSSLFSPSYQRRNLVPGTATQVHTTVLTSSANASTTAATTAAYKGLPQQQVSLSPTTTYASATTPTSACLSKSTSCPDSPIRRVSSNLRNSAVGLATRFFNKCRAATFTVDGATYTIGKLQTG